MISVEKSHTYNIAKHKLAQIFVFVRGGTFCP